MANREIKTTLKLEGESKFRSAMKSAADSIKVLNSEQKLAQAQFEATGNKEQFLSDKADILKRKIEEQQKAVKAAREAVQKLKDNGVEPTNKSMQEWTRKLNDSQAYLVRLQGDLNSTETELQQQGQAFEDAGEAADNYSQQLEGIGEGINFQNIISSLDTVQTKLNTTLTSIINLGKSLFDAEVQAAKWADDLLTASQTTGLDVETLQSWEYAAKLIDTDVDTIINAQDKLLKKLQSTSEDTQLTFNQLGVVTRNTDGSLRDYRDTFWDVIDALGKGKDAHGNLLTETEKDRIAQDLFGKSYRDLLPLINSGRDAWDELVDEGKQHVSVSEDNVKKLGELDDALNKFNSRMDYTRNTVLAAMAPAFTDATNKVSGLVDAFNEFLKTEEGKKALEDLGNAVSGLLDAFIGDVDFETVMKNATAAINGLTDVLKWISEHGWAVVGALVAIKGAVVGIEVAKSVLTALQLMKGIQWGNVQKGAESLGKAMSSGAPEKAAKEASDVGNVAAKSGWLSGLAAKAGAWLMESGTLPVAAAVASAAPVERAAYNRDFGRFSRVAEATDAILAIESAGNKQVADAQAVLGELQAIYKEFESQSGGGLSDTQAKAIFDLRKSVEEQTGKSYAILDELEAAFNRNGGNTFETDYDLQATLGNMIADLVELLQTKADTASETVKEAAETGVSDAGEKVVEESTSSYQDIIDKYKKEIAGIYDEAEAKIDAAYNELVPKSEQAGTDTAQGLADGINGNGAPEDAAGDMAQGVEDAVADTLQTHSPSVVMHNIGIGVAQGLADGINAGAAAAISAAQNLAAQVNAALASVQAASIGSYGGSIGRAITASPSYGGSGQSSMITGSINNVINISGKQVAQSITPFVNRNMATALKAATR